MAMTLLQMKAEYGADPMRQRLVEKFLTGSGSAVLPLLSFVDSADALGYNFSTDDDGGDIAERSMNAEYAISDAVTSPKSEKLTLFGGAIKTDAVILDLKGDAARLGRIDRRMRRMGKYFDKLFFHGQEIGEPKRQAKQFAGLRKRSIVRGRVLWAGANGGALTQDLMDEALDAVAGDNSNKVIFCSRAMRRKITNLLRGAAGGKGIPESSQQQRTYDGARVIEVEEDERYAKILDYNETRGNSNVTQSLYIARFGGQDDMDSVQGIRGPTFMKLRTPVNLGEATKDVVDNVLGICDFSPNCFMRIGGVLAA